MLGTQASALASNVGCRPAGGSAGAPRGTTALKPGHGRRSPSTRFSPHFELFQEIVMLRSLITCAGVLLLGASAFAQSNAHPMLRPVTSTVRDAGIYHVGLGTWTRH